MTVSLVSDTHVDERVLECLSSSHLFSNLPPRAADALIASAEVRDYENGATISSIGQFDGTEVLVVVQGALTVSHVDSGSGSMIFEKLDTGETYGLASALVTADEPIEMKRTLIADGETTILALYADALRDAARDTSELSFRLLMHFAANSARGDLQALSTETCPEQRVYAAILEVTDRDQTTGDWHVETMPKHRELADTAQVEEPVAAQAVAHLIQIGAAQRKYPGLIIRNIDELRRLAS